MEISSANETPKRTSEEGEFDKELLNQCIIITDLATLLAMPKRIVFCNNKMV